MSEGETVGAWLRQQFTFVNIITIIVAVGVGTALYKNLQFNDAAQELRIVTLEEASRLRAPYIETVQEHSYKISTLENIISNDSQILREMVRRQDLEESHFENINEQLDRLEAAISRIYNMYTNEDRGSFLYEPGDSGGSVPANDLPNKIGPN